MPTTTLDPAEAMRAAMAELYDELRAIVDRGPTDDPSLLDEIGKLTGRIRTRITRARKRAVELTAEREPVKPTTPVVPARPVPPAPTVLTTVAPNQPTTPRAVPATSTVAVPRVTVPIPPRTQPTRPIPAVAPATARPRVAEPTRTLPRWALLLVGILAVVLGTGIAVVTGVPLGIAAAIVAGVAVARVGGGLRRRHPDRRPRWS